MPIFGYQRNILKLAMILMDILLSSREATSSSAIHGAPIAQVLIHSW